MLVILPHDALHKRRLLWQNVCLSVSLSVTRRKLIHVISSIQRRKQKCVGAKAVLIGGPTHKNCFGAVIISAVGSPFH